MLRVDFVTLFPELVLGVTSHSILGRASQFGLASFRAVNPRDYTYDRHSKVDDTPFGGEPGMLIKAEPVALAIEALACGRRTAVVLTDPAGKPFCQRDANELSGMEHILFLCGHYEGIDDRVRATFATHVFSIGDYVLTNGEMPALVMADAIVRQMPGVLGNEGSLDADSFSNGLLSAPNFTRPTTWRGLSVPEVLLSGNHAAIAKWRRQMALEATVRTRPDLLVESSLSAADLAILSNLKPVEPLA